MNGRETNPEGRTTTSRWVLILLAGWCCAGWPSPVAAAPRPGQAGQAHGRESFDFSAAAAGERLRGPRAEEQVMRPGLRRGVGHPEPVTMPAEAIPTTDLASASAGTLASLDSALAFTAASILSPPPSASFSALIDNGTTFNPDTQGAVGPNHLMVTLSSQVRVQDRAGGVISTVSLATFWGTNNVFDPRVLYDPYGQRWISTALANPGTNGSAILIAVSQTTDPTGVWFRRTVRTDLGASIFPDSPNVGFTKDWITVTANMFDKTNFNYFSCDIWAFNKANLYANGAGTFTSFRYRKARLGEASVLIPAVNYDSAYATNFLVGTFDGNLFDPESNFSFGYLRFFSISGPVGAERFEDYGGVGGTNGIYAGFITPWASYPPNFANSAPQKGTTNRIYMDDARVQNVVFRNGFLWASQHIFLPAGAPNRTSIQWIEATPGGSLAQNGLLDDPTGATSYGYPSLAVNASEDVVIGFSSFSGSRYPSAGYAFHSYVDGNGALRDPVVLKAGETNFFLDDRGVNHWGDWSAAVVDPNNDLDLWTLQEYAVSHLNGTNRWGTWWGRVSPLTDLTLAAVDAPDPVFAGSNVTYTVRVTNLLETVATGVRIVDTLPPGAVFVSGVASQGACGATNGVVTCNFGDVAGLANLSATIVATLNLSGSDTNTIVVSAYGADGNPADNTVKVLTTVSPTADLTVLMAASQDPASVGGLLTYTVTATNRGPSVATAVSLSDTLPPSVTFVSASPPQGTCSQNAGIVNCNLGTLTGGARVDVPIVVRPNAPGQLTNRASVATTALDPNPANNSVTLISRANTPPTIQSISDRTINEDTVLGPISFTVGDVETPAANLTLSPRSSNPAIVPLANIQYGGSGSSRTITVTPAPNANGAVTITTVVADTDGGTASNSFVLTIIAINDPPTISLIPNQTTPEDVVLGPIAFTVGDIESAPGTLLVTAASSNSGLIPNGNIVLGGSGASRTITLTPTTNQSGTATITVTVSDGAAATNTSFIVTVTPVNDVPVVSAITDRIIAEDGTTGPITFTVSDVESAAATLVPFGGSSNPTVVPTNSIVFGGSGSTRTVTVTPATNQFGTVLITVFVADPDAGVGSNTFSLTVVPVNDPPTIGSVTNLIINEDPGLVVIALTNITAGAPNEFQTISIVAASSNPALIPNPPTVNYTSPSPTGTLSFTPVTNASGTATLTLTVNDNGASNNITTRQIFVTVIPVNDPPTISDIPNLTIDEDSTTGALPFTIGDVDSPLSSLSVSGRASDPNMVPDQNIIFGGSGANRTVTVTPATNQFGTVTITVFATDGAATNSKSFVLTIVGINDQPTISFIADWTIDEDTPTNISFTIGDPETPAGSLTLSGSSSNPALVPIVNFGGGGSNRTVNIVPALNKSGTAVISVNVFDGDGASNSTTFVLTVLPVNDPPTLDPIADRTVVEDGPAQTVLLTGISSGAPDEIQTLSVRAVSSLPASIPNPTVSYISASPTGTLTFTPTPDSNGTVTITVFVSDGQATNSRSFDVTILPVNDPPVLGAIPSQTIDEDTTLTIPFYVSDLETPPDQLILVGASSNPDLLDDTGISFGGSGTNRTIILTPLPDASDSVTTISITAIDGSNATARIEFELTVLPINDAPRITGLTNLTINEDAITVVPFVISDPETLPSDLIVSVSSSNAALLPSSNVILGGSGSFRTLTFKPLTNEFGVSTVQVVVRDAPGAAGLATTNTILVTVRDVNDPPTLDPIGDVTVAEDPGPQVVNLSGIGTGAPNEIQTLVVSARSGDPALMPDPIISYHSPDPVGTLTFLPATNANGVVTISVTVNDGGTENSNITRTFHVTITPVNDPPFFIGPGPQVVEQNSTTAIPFIVGDPESPPSALTLAVSSSNQALLPDASLSIVGTGTNRTLNATPVAGQLGTSIVSLRARDPEGLSITNSFLVTVVLANMAPTLNPIAAVTMNEDDPPLSIPLTGITTGSPTEIQTLTVTATSSNPSILPDPPVFYLSPAQSGSLTLAPRPNSNGVVIVTVTVNDGGPSHNLFSRMFTVTINPVNDAPIILPVADQSTSEDVPAVVSVTLVDFDTAPGSLTLTASCSNPALVAPSGISVTGNGSVRTLTLTPVANQFGTATITLVAGDGAAFSTNRFLLTVVAVNDPPTISHTGNTNMNEDAQITLPFVVGDVETPAAQLAVTADSSDAVLLPPSAIIFGGSGANRTVTLAPATNQSGSVTVTLTVSDLNGASTSDSFVLTVVGVNDPPTLTGLPNLTLAPGVSTGPLPVTVGDVETPVANLTLTAVSQNTTLVPNANIIVAGTGAGRTITVNPAPNQTGSATLLLTLSDGSGGTTNTSFTVTVASANNPPTLNALSNLTLNEDPGLQSVNLLGISAGAGENQPISITALSSNPSLIPNPAITYTSPNPTGTLTFTPVTNASGTATITVIVSDGQPVGGTFTRSFNVTVNPVNDAPTISNIPDQTTAEDVPLTVGFTIGDAETPAFALALSGTSGNTGLVAATNILFNGSGSNRTVTVIPSPNQFGTTLITVFVTDGVLTNNDTFQLTVSPVNDPPTLNPIPNFSANTANGHPSFTVPLSGISSGAANETQTLTVTATSSNTGFLPNPTVTYTSPNPTATLTLNLGNNATGNATVTVTVNDGGSSNNTVVQTFAVNIKASGNVFPTISIIPTQNLNEDSSSTISFTVRDAETPAASLTLRAFSSNQELLPDASLILGGSGSNRTVTITPVANRSGTANVTLGVTDDSFGSSNMTFTVNVAAVNDPPTLTGIPNQTVNDATPTAPLPFTIGDLETAPGNLAVTAVSANQTLVPNGNLVLGGSGSNRVLVVTPAIGQVGSALITVTVSDGAASTNSSFTLTVNAFNDPPTISDVTDQTTALNTPTAPLAVTIGDPETPAANLSFLSTASNPSLVPVTAFAYGGSGSNRTVTITPASGVAGTSLITNTVSDGTNQVSRTFLFTVVGSAAVSNAPPVLDPIANVTLSQSGPPRVINLTGISAGAGESGQPVILAASSSNPAIVLNPVVNYSSPAAAGTLVVAAAPNASGSALITVTVSDGQAALTRTFTATINTAPVLSTLANRVSNEDTAAVVNFSVTDADDAPANLTVNATSSNLSVVPAAGVALTGSGNYTLTLTPADNQSGFTTITVTASDGSGNTTARSFLLTVVPVNDPPTLAALPDLQVPMNSGPQIVNLTGIGSGAANEVQTLSVTAESSDPTIIPAPSVNYTSPAATGTLTFIPVAGAIGSAAITVTVRDNGDTLSGGVNTTRQTFTITVGGAPSLLIERLGGNAVISWTTNAGGAWTLQGNTNLASSTSWTAAGSSAVVSGRYTVTNSLAPPARFYRLQK